MQKGVITDRRTNGSDVIERPKFRLQMPHQGPVIEGFSGHPLDQLRGPIALPVSMDLFPQPAQQRLEFTRG